MKTIKTIHFDSADWPNCFTSIRVGEGWYKIFSYNDIVELRYGISNSFPSVCELAKVVGTVCIRFKYLDRSWIKTDPQYKKYSRSQLQRKLNVTPDQKITIIVFHKLKSPHILERKEYSSKITHRISPGGPYLDK